jgi:phosphate transport system substrate-binding protein
VFALETGREDSVAMAGVLRLVYAPLLALTLAQIWSLASAQESPRIIIAAAQSLVPLAESFTAQFQKEHPGVQIEIWSGRSNYALEAVRSGQADVGLVARSLTPSEEAQLRVETLGHDAIIMLTYPGNIVTGLSLPQLREIYRGRVTNWRQLGGQDKGIIPLTREHNSAIHGIFIERLFGRELPGEEKAFTIRASKDKVLRTVKRIEGAVGYGIVHLEEAQHQGVKVLAVEGKLPTTNNIQSGLYHFVRPQLLDTRVDVPAIVKEWSGRFRTFVPKPAVLGNR